MDKEQRNLSFDRIKDGDEDTFNEVFNHYYARLCYFADNYIHDFDLSRSIVQQVFVDLWIKRSEINILHSIKGYLFKTVRNDVLDFLKHKKVESKYLEYNKSLTEEVSYNNSIEEAELNDKINSAIHKLPAKCKEIFILCRFEEMKYADIASHLNISIKTVEMQMSIALKKIRNNISDYQYIDLLAFIFCKKK